MWFSAKWGATAPGCEKAGGIRPGNAAFPLGGSAPKKALLPRGVLVAGQFAAESESDALKFFRMQMTDKL